MHETQPEIPPPQRKRHLLRGLGAAVTTTLTLAGGGDSRSMSRTEAVGLKEAPMTMLAPSADTLTRPLKFVDISGGQELVRRKLNWVSELPGYGHEVSPDKREKLQVATVKIIKRPISKDAKTPWTEGCTGIKVQIDGGTYVTTAAHCFRDIAPTRNNYGIISSPTGLRATDYINFSPFEYAIADPLLGYPVRNDIDVPKLGAVDGISIYTRPGHGTDIALLRVQPERSIAPDQKGPAYRTFDDLPALSYDTNRQHLPLPGEWVALYGFPGSESNAPVVGNGIYMGRAITTYENFDKTIGWREIDYVGFNPASREEDACFFGASGSAAIGASGYLFGALAIRNLNMGRPEEYDIKNRERSPLFNIRDKFSVICGYSVIPPVSNMPRELVAGFGVYLETK